MFFTEYCPAPEIEPTTFRSAVKRSTPGSTHWANPAAVKDNYIFIIQNSSKLDIVRYWFTNFLKNYKQKSCIKVFENWNLYYRRSLLFTRAHSIFTGEEAGLDILRKVKRYYD